MPDQNSLQIRKINTQYLKHDLNERMHLTSKSKTKKFMFEETISLKEKATKRKNIKLVRTKGWQNKKMLNIRNKILSNISLSHQTDNATNDNSFHGEFKDIDKKDKIKIAIKNSQTDTISNGSSSDDEEPETDQSYQIFNPNLMT